MAAKIPALFLKQRQTPGTALPQSTQVYRWPVRLKRLTRAAFYLSALFFAGGAGAVIWDMQVTRESSMLTAGLLFEVLGSMGLVSLAILVTSCAREVRFTRDALILRQPLREDLTLPYATYEIEWVADTTGGSNIRIIIFHPHRGCIVLQPAHWFRMALAEIERIQEEEGWYDPTDEASPHRVDAPLANSQS